MYQKNPISIGYSRFKALFFILYPVYNLNDYSISICHLRPFVRNHPSIAIPLSAFSYMPTNRRRDSPRSCPSFFSPTRCLFAQSPKTAQRRGKCWRWEGRETHKHTLQMSACGSLQEEHPNHISCLSAIHHSQTQRTQGRHGNCIATG